MVWTGRPGSGIGKGCAEHVSLVLLTSGLVCTVGYLCTTDIGYGVHCRWCTTDIGYGVHCRVVMYY
eukprot:2330173-Rhodomonas_salina.1